MGTSTSTSRLGRLGLWALIGIVGLMATALIATAWSTTRAVDSASATLVRGQAQVFRDAVASSSPRRSPPTDEILADVLDDRADDGLRYVAVFDRTGALLARAGTSVAAVDDFDVGAGNPAYIDGRVRSVFGRPRARRARRPRRARRQTTVVVEFEPRVADQLESAANSSLAIGGIASVALILFAAALVRWYQRAAARERAAEHARRLVSLGEMSAVLAHEIRNPIASLKGNAQLLVKMLPDADKPRAKAERLVGESVRLEALTNDLLEFARAAAVERNDVDPAALLRETASTSDGDIEIDDGDAPARWSLDASRMRQVLANLLDNARHASDQPAHARVALGGRTLIYTVRDRGPGIDDGDADRIFEPFYTRKPHGTGLGLAVSRRIVELHGGTLTAANHPDGGAVFRVAIPHAKD